jgi:RNA-directed DNA polymerase
MINRPLAGRSLMSEAGSSGKSFDIPKGLVYRAWMKVKENKGAAGVDGQSVEEFEQDLRDNLYRIWNRMSSGSYFPPPVKAVEIPKAAGSGVRVLGVPTVADRVAQTVVAMVVEPEAEKVFHPDSYGYRPGKSALDAVGRCRQRCWMQPWVIDLDIKAFFDTVPHDLVLKAVERHTTHRWVMLYVTRWLRAPLQRPDGQLERRDRGTPQGSAISPLLANLFMHYAFDVWMSRKHPRVRFERYCDDAVIHCDTKARAEYVRGDIAARFAEVGIELHPDKTKIVYCPQDGRPQERPGDFVEFTFLGYSFARNTIVNKNGQIMLGFVPAIGKQAAKAIGRTIRWWRLGRRTDLELQDLARWINPIVAGWINYYGRFYKSRVVALLQRLNWYLEKWARRKYKRLRYKPVQARKRLAQVAATYPGLFIHWRHGALPTA